MTLAADLQSLEPGTLVSLYELDNTALPGGSILRFHAGVGQKHADVYWQGWAYQPWPIEVEGFEWRGQGSLPTPTMKVANVNGLIAAAAREMDDLIGAKLTRIRTFARYLDAVNFDNGNPTADPNAELTRDVFYVNRKVNENKLYVEFELASALSVFGVKLPRRQVIANTCLWDYRGPDCGYTGPAVADEHDVPTTDITLDRCSHRLSGCRLRHGNTASQSGPGATWIGSIDGQPITIIPSKKGLPFGGFPGAGLVRR